MIGVLKQIARRAATSKRPAVVFPWELSGQTLVLRPRGDLCGFSRLDTQIELDALRKLIDAEKVDSLVIDFSEADYFGSEILGHFFRLAQHIKENDGKVAVCEASGSMRFLFKVVQLDRVWPSYSTLSVALAAVKRTPEMAP